MNEGLATHNGKQMHARACGSEESYDHSYDDVNKALAAFFKKKGGKENYREMMNRNARVGAARLQAYRREQKRAKEGLG
jgi:hypothetical protein